MAPEAGGNGLYEIRRDRLEVDGEELHVLSSTPREIENPATVILCHGAGSSHLAFFQQITVLSHTHRVVVWDQRGFGASTARTGRLGPLVAGYDLLAVLETVCAEEPAHLVGQSMGGWAAIRAATLAPEKISSIVLSGSVGGMFTAATRDSLDRFIERLEQGADRPVLAGVNGAIAPSFAQQMPALANLYQMFGLLPNAGWDAVRRIRATEFAITDVAALGLPMLFVCGEHDEIFAADQVASLAARIPTANFVRIDEAGHSPYFERAEQFNRTISDFLSAVDASSTESMKSAAPSD